MRKSPAFTLIELLIVVAIIGVLAAIAVPNFLQAQIRAKLARVQADFQSLSVAIESYKMDNNHYPLYGEYTFPNPKRNLISYRLIPLTKPVAYINDVDLPDPFLKVLAGTGWDDDKRRLSYAYRNYEFWEPGWQFDAWALCSFGPDRDFDGGLNAELWARGHASTLESEVSHPSEIDFVIVYNLTNGLYSSGDIVRTGGDTRLANSTE